MELVKQIFGVGGMSCASCASSVEQTLNKTRGIKTAAVNLADNTVTVEYNDVETNFDDIRKKVTSTGYDLYRMSSEYTDEIERKQLRLNYMLRRLILSAILTIPVFGISMFMMHQHSMNYLLLVLTLPVMIFGGRDFFTGAYKRALHFSANMDTLIATGSGIAFLFSVFNTFFPEYFLSQGIETHVYYESAAVIITFVLTGKYFEERAKQKTSGSITRLLNLSAKTARVVRSGQEIEISVQQVIPGDEIVVKAGEKIPVDGIIEEGSAVIDESMISGESMMVEKRGGHRVIGATLNQSGYFRMMAQKSGSDGVLSQIVKMVKEAQGSKAPVQQYADKIASWFVPSVILLAIVTFVCWWMFGGDKGFALAINNAINVLIIACPCALGLATPTAIMVALGKSAEKGILIKNAESLEKLRTVTAIVLDKTGTITEGRPEVVDEYWLDSEHAQLKKNILYEFEKRSGHPLSGPICQHLKSFAKDNIPIDSYKVMPGFGITGIVNDHQYYVGNMELLCTFRQQFTGLMFAESERLQNEGNTVIYFATDGQVLGLVALSDKMKPGVPNVIKKLEQRNLHVHLVTGDNPHTAQIIAHKAGIEKVKAGVLPGGKIEYVRNLQSHNHIVVMIGDGINDSPALAQADVGIALSSGTDIAMSSASVTFLGKHINLIFFAIKISNATHHIIRQNLFWAFVYNLVTIPIAAGLLYPFTGYLLSPMIAGAAMSLSSISVVTNSLRLKRIKAEISD